MNLPSLTKAEFYALLDRFMKLLESEQNERVKEQHPSLHESALKEGRRGYTEIGYDEGLRFVKVWADRGGKYVKYFVEKDTGIIFGAKGWKAYNPIHVYGDLTTIADWSWGEYYATHKQGMKSMVPKAFRR
jgi:hypothetical protein